MKRLIIFILLLSPIAILHAQYADNSGDWIYIGQTNEVKAYLKSNYVEKEGNEIKIWQKWVYKKPYKYKGKIYPNFSYLTLSKFDCVEEKTCWTYMIFYSNGKIIKSSTSDYDSWTPVVPGSLGEDLLGKIRELFY